MIEVGDHVIVGKGKGGVHWIVESLEHFPKADWANLRSPMSGRRRREPLGYLDLHSKGTA